MFEIIQILRSAVSCINEFICTIKLTTSFLCGNIFNINKVLIKGKLMGGSLNNFSQSLLEFQINFPVSISYSRITLTELMHCTWLVLFR